MVDISTSRKRLPQSLEIPSKTITLMTLLKLMTSNNPKMDWWMLYFNYRHNLTFNFDYTLSRFNDYFVIHKANRSGSNVFLTDVYQIWDEIIWLTPEKRLLLLLPPYSGKKQSHPQKLVNNLMTVIGNTWDFCLRK